MRAVPRQRQPFGDRGQRFEIFDVQQYARRRIVQAAPRLQPRQSPLGSRAIVIRRPSLARHVLASRKAQCLRPISLRPQRLEVSRMVDIEPQPWQAQRLDRDAHVFQPVPHAA